MLIQLSEKQNKQNTSMVYWKDNFAKMFGIASESPEIQVKKSTPALEGR